MSVISFVEGVVVGGLRVWLTAGVGVGSKGGGAEGWNSHCCGGKRERVVGVALACQ